MIIIVQGFASITSNSRFHGLGKRFISVVSMFGNLDHLDDSLIQAGHYSAAIPDSYALPLLECEGIVAETGAYV